LPHLLFVKIIEFRSFLRNRPGTALLLLRISRTRKFGIVKLWVENGKPSIEEIRKYSRVGVGAWE
jgi:hypothetical protein